MSELAKLRDLMRSLRDPQRGCPWDLAQSYRSIVPHTLEEAYEVADVIESGQMARLPGELGDLLFQVVYYCQLAEEEGRFSFDDVVDAIEQKLIDRHPHVFGDASRADLPSVTMAWEAHKSAERRARAQCSELDDVALTLPALSRATKIQQRASRVGFDWPNAAGAWGKVDEELAELRDVCQSPVDLAAVNEEFGDLVFSMVNVARHIGVGAEASLRAATRKFERRFRAVEQRLQARDSTMEAASAELLDELWEAVKAEEKAAG
jgi:ATP diphosphatase